MLNKGKYLLRKYRFEYRIKKLSRQGYSEQEIFAAICKIPKCGTVIYIGNNYNIYTDSYKKTLTEIMDNYYGNQIFCTINMTEVSLADNINFIIYDDLSEKYVDVKKQFAKKYSDRYISKSKFLIDMETYRKIVFIRLSSLGTGLLLDQHIAKLDRIIRQKKIKMYYFQECGVSDLTDLSEYEQRICNGKGGGNILSEDYDVKDQYECFAHWDEDLKKLYGEKYSDEYIEKIRSMRNVQVIKRNGIPYRVGYSELVNYVDGNRRVVGAPGVFSQTIQVLGRSTTLGGRLEDADTLPSQLQECCNRAYKPIRVVDFSVGGGTLDLLLKKLKKTRLKKGDIVLLFLPYYSKLKKYFEAKDTYYDLKELVFDSRNEWKNGQEIFFDNTHYNALAAKKIAEATYNCISRDISEHSQKLWAENMPFLLKVWLCRYNGIVKMNEGKKQIGVIVMNCNPFTLGHKYLIDEALSKTDFLYVFIVEEDRSVFPFKERLNLVKEQYKDCRDICVMGGGRYIISKNTFPEYFDKEKLQNESINPVMDLSIFGKWIAPALNISIRFVGTEPKDRVTNQYNMTMKEVLKDYGITVCEIPRKYVNDQVISATNVRKYWTESRYDELKQIVPEVTYNYLIKKKPK